MSKKQLLSDIMWADQLSIGRVSGEVVWGKFLELQPDDEIVVIGNGPVCSFHGEYIENAKMVVRCNHYSEHGKTSSEEGRRKIGEKCDVQFICLHGSVCLAIVGRRGVWRVWGCSCAEFA